MIVCKVCGFDNEAGAQFCGSCGSFLEWTGELSEPEPQQPSSAAPPTPPADAGATMAAGPDLATAPYAAADGIPCRNCGTINERDRVFCRHCAIELVPALAPVMSAGPSGQGIGRLPLIIGGVLAGVLVVGVVVVAGGFLDRKDGVSVVSPSPTAAASQSAAPSPTPSATATSSPTPPPSPTPTPRPEPSGRIAWTSGTTGNGQIVTSAPDGSRIVSVFKIAGNDIQPAWSPNGKRIAFASALGIRVVNAKDGGKAVLFTHHDELDRGPEFAPDGAVIAFASSRGGDFEIYLRDVGGTNLVNLTNDPGNDDDPSWSATTNLIAFSSDRAGDRDIWTMRANGKAQVQLTGTEGEDDHPAWSPDGTRIAFTSDRDGTEFIYIMDADGSGVRRLTAGDSAERHATWSPDGLYIAYRVGTGSSAKIAVVSVDDGVEYATFGEDGKAASYPAWH